MSAIFANSTHFFMTTIRTVNMTRYVTPLREGGSLPAIAEADDGFLYVIKFRGAGQGVKSLVAEFIGGEIARLMGLKVPELAFCHLDAAFGRTEPDEEIQDLLKASTGLNIGLHYLRGSITYDPHVTKIDAETASKIVWLDAYLMNMDRTVRNTNMLLWYREVWLIDHGACLYFHHNWDSWLSQMKSHFPLIKNHVLLPCAANIEAVNTFAKSLITDEKIIEIVHQIPEEWLAAYPEALPTEEIRKVYIDFLIERKKHSIVFVNSAIDARTSII